MKRSSTIAVLACVLLLSSCGGNSGKDTSTVQTEVAAAPAETTSPATAEVQHVLALEGNDQMQYNTTTFRVAAGKPITLTLKHSGTMDKNIMGHNFVLLKQGTDIAAFAQKAMAAKDHEYIPQSESTRIIAYTKLLGGGEADTITFELAEKGAYDFICTFPGHYAMMKGKLIVE